MRKLLLMLFLSALPALGQSDATPVKPVGDEDAFQGLKSVAEKADQDWSAAHAGFRNTAALAQNPCEAGPKSVARAQNALKERTRAWKEFYKQHNQDSETSKKYAAVVEANTEEELRAEQKNISQASDLITELKRREENLEGPGATGLDGEDLAKAKESLTTQISVRGQSVKNSEVAIKNYQEIIRQTRIMQEQNGSDAALAKMFGDLIDSEEIMYSSIYRAREIRLSLECRKHSPPPPPKPPQP